MFGLETESLEFTVTLNLYLMILPCSSLSDFGVIGVLVIDTCSGFQDLFLEKFNRFCFSSPKGVSPIPNKDIINIEHNKNRLI